MAIGKCALLSPPWDASVTPCFSHELYVYADTYDMCVHTEHWWYPIEFLMFHFEIWIGTPTLCPIYMVAIFPRMSTLLFSILTDKPSVCLLAVGVVPSTCQLYTWTFYLILDRFVKFTTSKYGSPHSSLRILMFFSEAAALRLLVLYSTSPATMSTPQYSLWRTWSRNLG